MEIIFKPSFQRDTGHVKDRELLIVLKEKVQQISKAQSVNNITGLKLLKGYSHQFRIVVKTGRFSYRIGDVIRKNKIWMVRFLPRKIIYEKFP